MILNTASKLKPYLSTITGVVIGTLCTLSISHILAQVNNTVITACYKNSNGSLRILHTNESCGGNETPISWNQQGPQGPVGATGSVGSGENEFGGYTTNQLINYNNINEPFLYRNFSRANFTNSEIREFIYRSEFSHAILKNSTINAVITESNFSDVDFSNTNFENSTIDQSNLSNSNFTNAIFTNTQINNSSFIDAVWSNTTCPDGTNSDNNGNTCEGHLVP